MSGETWEKIWKDWGGWIKFAGWGVSMFAAGMGGSYAKDQSIVRDRLDLEHRLAQVEILTAEHQGIVNGTKRGMSQEARDRIEIVERRLLILEQQSIRDRSPRRQP